MSNYTHQKPSSRFLSVAVLVVTLALSACAKRDPSQANALVFDPYEQSNRQMHEFNLAVDRAIVRPAGKGYSNFLPDDIENAISRFAFNLSLPRAVVNNILQGNMRGATEDTYRFIVNSTLGLGGFFDPATELNMPVATDADFGETLHAWGAREGAYVELPFLGPSTQRDTWGMVVDVFTNPLSYIIDPPANYYGTAASVSSGLSNRGRFSDTIDSVLYESADSYAQSRSLYLQKRRFDLGNGGDNTYHDPYDDPYSDSYEDPYDE